MKKLLANGLASLLTVTIIIAGCSKGGDDNDNNNPPPPPPAGCTGTPGPLFTAVKTLMQANCQSCHNSGNMNGGKDWTVDCNIVANKNRIKARAVDEGINAANRPAATKRKR